MALKSLLILCHLGLVASLAPGDCAFVGIYGDQDDFAVVLMEDADGEVLSLTEEYPTNDHFKVSKSVMAKTHVSDAKRGAVLKKADFEADSASFVAPTALTVFTGSQEAPTPLCSINLEAKQGNVARKLSEEVSVVMLGLTETAQYAGSTSGSKEELLEDISNPSNWLRDASRKLSGFSIAKGGNVTMTESTTMKLNMTMTDTTTGTTVVTMTDTTTMTVVPSQTVVSGCTDLGGAVESLVDSQDAVAAFTTAIAGVASVPEDYVKNVVFTAGSTCGGRRLDGRRLQTTGTVTYVSKFAVAKPHVKDAKGGAVLRKADFETDSTSFVAPTALTVFSGPAESPSALCSITLEAKQGSVTRKLSEEVSVVELGLTETAQYAGSTSGSKAELLEDIANPSNWIRDASRQLSGFSIAKGGNGTVTETTSVKPGNVTMTESTTMEVTESVMETTTVEATRTVVSGCTELGGAVADLVDSKDAVAAFTTAIAGVVDVPEDYVQNVVFTDGSTCGGRRLGARRLQTTGTVTYDLVFPASLGAGAQEAAEAAITALESATAESVSTALTSAMETYSSLADITVTVENVGSLVTSESGGTTPEPTEAPETTEAEDEGPPDAACGAGGLALGLMAMVGHSIF